MKLNIGCSDPRGRYELPEWINIDCSRYFRGAQEKRFLIADGCQLPFRDESFDEVHAVHVLEHVPREIVLGGKKVNAHATFMAEVRRVLTPEGHGFIEVPDFIRNCQMVSGYMYYLQQEGYADYTEQFREMIRIKIVGTFGKGRHEGDWHHWGFTPWALESLFTAAGLLYSRETEMISTHYRAEPVLLYRVWRGSDHRSR